MFLVQFLKREFLQKVEEGMKKRQEYRFGASLVIRR